jgi:pantoate--beta-alanine ligase
MGYLHEGHLALVRRSRAENDVTAVSIFVNPTQFGAGEDFNRYPRDEERDLALLRAEGVDGVYLPTVDAVYPPGYQTYVTVEEVTKPLEGASRPGHFRGVATVVLKLFTAIEPERAYFGRKDAQQVRVIERMTRDLDLRVAIVRCDTVREADGLAMSSRNVYLSPAERAAAPVLYRALCRAREAYGRGERDGAALRRLVSDTVAAEPLARVEYVSVADDASLEEVEGAASGPLLVSLAAGFGRTRLIDNIELR